MIAQIATDIAADRAFDYTVPDELSHTVRAGSMVRVSFGKRVIEGFVLSLTEQPMHAGVLKPILEVCGERPYLSDAMLRLARWMADYYVAPLELCLRTMLPAPVRRNVAEKTVLMVEKGAQAFQPVETDTQAGKPVLLSTRHTEILALLSKSGTCVMSAFCRDYHVTPATLRRMEKDGLVRIFEKVFRRDPLEGRTFVRSSPLALNTAQADAKAIILAEMRAEKPKPVLLRGVTASGKTEVFLQAIAEALAEGKGAIVLVPEIALTPQTIQRFASRFGDITAVLHSQLSDGERRDEWRRIHSGGARVVVGPRSAVFAPVERLGLIVVDEEHEPSYKQDDTPRYNARDVAVMRGALESCTVVLGSATPSLESWRNTQIGKYRLTTMATRAVDMMMPLTRIIDMNGETAKHGARSIFSDPLIEAVRLRLARGEQTMLFLNRRGYAPVVTCPGCGHTETCADCSVGMTYHIDGANLRCHICGEVRTVPRVCPECGDADYRFQGIGTQRVEAVARRLFPRADIQRMDADVTSRKMSHEEILTRFRAGKTDILIGTQMIAKGLDFPNVTLAGILNADTALNIPDFRASERAFQLIAQMAGRSGRGAIQGEVFVQTYDPEHPAIVFACNEDFDGFSAHELDERAQLSYPPYTRFARVLFRGTDLAKTESYATAFASAIPESPTYIKGAAAPSYPEKAKKHWLYQMTLRGTDARILNRALRATLAALPSPSSIQVNIDIDAM